MKEVKLSSGAILGLQMADFEDGTALYQTLCAELVGIQIPMQATDLKSMASMDISVLKDGFLKLMASKAIYSQVWKCMNSCTYAPAGTEAPLRILKNTFQTEEARKDFLPVAWEVLSYNLAPFFESLGSLFQAQSGVAVTPQA